MWKQVPNKDAALASKIGRTVARSVVIPLAKPGTASPILRMNALPLSQLPTTCLELAFTTAKEWSDLHAAEKAADGKIVCTKGRSVFAWGSEASLRHAFGADLQSMAPASIEKELHDLQNNLHLKGFVERGISLALMRGKPLIFRTWRGGSVLILDKAHPMPELANEVKRCVGELYGRVPGLTAPPTDEHPKPEEVWWAEAIKLDLEEIDGRYFSAFEADRLDLAEAGPDASGRIP